MGKMLENDPIVDSLIDKNPFKDKKSPKYVRARHYKVRQKKSIIEGFITCYFSTHSPRVGGNQPGKESGGAEG